MTDGTSQGLFLVVAIVIFGIFVVMAYILFEDTLSPALANMFVDATEQATTNLKDTERPFNTYDFKYGVETAERLIKRTKNSISWSSPTNNGAYGVYIPVTAIKPNTTYAFEYDITLLEGGIYRLGGHLSSLDYGGTYVNGVPLDYTRAYTKGFDYDMGINETVHIKVVFKTRDRVLGDDDRVYIQPNRQTSTNTEQEPYRTTYTVRIDNARFIEIE